MARSPKKAPALSHPMPLEEVPAGYKKFHDEQGTHTKLVVKRG